MKTTEPRKTVKKGTVYMIGIKGVGMTMLAQFLAARGYKVSGSDIADTFMTDKVLKKAGIKVRSPFLAANLPDQADLIVYSSAFNPENNPEMAAVFKDRKRFPAAQVLSYAQALGHVFNTYQGLAVCGSHGKTTTSAWLGYVLEKAGRQPNVLSGASIPQFGGSALVGNSKIFVAEVDEYQNKLRYFQPRGVVLNNIEFDHPDFYKDQAAYTKAFADFLKKVPVSGFAVINTHDPETKKIKKYCRGRLISCGLESDPETAAAKPDYVAGDLCRRGDFQTFTVKGRGEFKIRLWGEHNVRNALAVIAAARQLGVPFAAIKEALAGFRGADRRCQVLGRFRGATIIDDYAHHPTEIRATLAAVRDFYGPEKRINVLFHPHTFTRTKALFPEFVRSFEDADTVSVLDIYGSAREQQGGVSSPQLVEAIKEENRSQGRKQAVHYLGDLEKAAAYFRKNLKPGEILLLLGAGDVFRVGEKLLEK